jgi:2-C-methyl-D-erythritol 4-phosphate cytidylyltransferase/2-C-methyl-D-erythritol 4-phosphate cytidylyltransferase/2-C-methyl-D-erythritol 2,4-cyclodiphosphate synthase
MKGEKKEYRPLGPGLSGPGGEAVTVLGASVLAFAASPRIGVIVITVPEDPASGEAAARASLPASVFKSAAIRFVTGGPTRRASVHKALAFLASWNPAYALIHDGARPWIDGGLIEALIDAVMRNKAVIPLLPLTETPKELNREGLIIRHLERSKVGTAQTPQAFEYSGILGAHERAALREEQEGIDYTDDAQVWGEFLGPVAVIPGSPANRKITFPEDLTP